MREGRPPEPGQPTLDQLRVFVAVVEEGGFTAAGRALKRATSVISYTISSLEAQLGLALFDRGAARRPELTEAGRAMFAEARAVASGVDGLRAKARSLLQGEEAELRIVLDVLFPEQRVADALSAFTSAFPAATLHLQVEALGGVTQAVLDGRAMVGVSGPLATDAAGIERVVLGSVTMIAVAAPGHPLAQAGIPSGAARKQLQLVLADRSQMTAGRDFGVVSPRTWRLGDLAAKHMLLKLGIGWGNMPEPMVLDDLAAGRLVRLDLPDTTGAPYAFDAIYRTEAPPGPAARWLITHLAAQMGAPAAADAD